LQKGTQLGRVCEFVVAFIDFLNKYWNFHATFWHAYFVEIWHKEVLPSEILNKLN
jgi:hypothetical protein